MITREEYNRALDIVEAYHKQLYIAIVANETKPVQKVKAGDYAHCIKPFKQSKNCLTKGKKYRIIKAKLYYNKIYFYIIDDNDKIKSYPYSNSQFMIESV